VSSFYTFDLTGNNCQSLTSAGIPNYTHLVNAFGFSRSSGQDLYDGMGAQFGYRDENTGFLYLLGHRFYDAQFGQFMTRDPMGYDGGINLYGYVGNNPVNESDPDGTFAVAAPVVVGAAAAALLAWLYWYEVSHGKLPPIYFNPPWSHPITDYPGEVPSQAADSGAASPGTGAKSREEYEHHEEKLKIALEQEQELLEALGRAKGPKSRIPLEKELENLRNGRNGIRGHRKEIAQKWPNGCPVK